MLETNHVIFNSIEAATWVMESRLNFHSKCPLDWLILSNSLANSFFHYFFEVCILYYTRFGKSITSRTWQISTSCKGNLEITVHNIFLLQKKTTEAHQPKFGFGELLLVCIAIISCNCRYGILYTVYILCSSLPSMQHCCVMDNPSSDLKCGLFLSEIVNQCILWNYFLL